MNPYLQSVIQQLRDFDWRFADYNPSLERVNINNIHWYPAPFVPHIPSILVKSLSNPGDIVLDPFCGTGITGIEAARLNRRSIQFDINPLAVEIAGAKLMAVKIVDDEFTERIKKIVSSPDVEILDPIASADIQIEEAQRWFHAKTLSQLIALKRILQGEPDESVRLILKLVLSSILYAASSQPKHYSYVTDNCHPDKLIERNAIGLFMERLTLLSSAAKDFRTQCELNGTSPLLVSRSVTEIRDSRDLSILPTDSIDMVVTSPPYVGVNDYVKSQRLTYLLFPPFPAAADSAEIGRRQKRRLKTAAADYLSDLRQCLDEIARVTRPEGFVCMALGQSSSMKTRDLVEELVLYLGQKLGHVPLVDIRRPIVFRKIYNAGIGTERLVVFQKM